MATPIHEQLGVRETARRLGVHENTVRNWASRGILRPSRLLGSGYRRFDANEVAQMAEEMRNPIAPALHSDLDRPEKVEHLGNDNWTS